MQIAYHVGVNCTDHERLLRSLVRSADLLSQAGIALPGPGRYRKLLRETVQAMTEGELPEGTRDVLIDAICDTPDATRMILSNAAFFCQPNRIFENGRFFDMAAFKMESFRKQFPQDDLTVFMAVRNPATFVPAVWQTSRSQHIGGYLGAVDPRSLAWAEVVTRMRAAAPDIPLVIWANEDTALIWNTILHCITGLGPEVKMAGAHDVLETIMEPEGFRRFTAYLDSHPPASDLQLRRIIGAFLDKYVIAAEIEEEFAHSRLGRRTG